MSRWATLFEQAIHEEHFCPDKTDKSDKRPDADPFVSSVAFVTPRETLNADAREAAASADEFEERDALIEDGSGAPRDWSEGFARACTMKRPDGVSEDRWLRFLNDGGDFLDRWAHQAAALGWSATDVFGVHPARPLARFDCAGLVWLLDGGEVAAISADRAEIRMPRGALQTYYRRTHPTEAVVVWELGQMEPANG